MSAKPLPDRTVGKSDRSRGRDEATERAEAAPLNLGCGTLLMLFLLVATAGKFLPHGDKTVKTAAKPAVTQPLDAQKNHETAPVVLEQWTDTTKKPASPEPKAPQPKPVASPPKINPAAGFDGLLSQLGDWVGRSERNEPQPAPAKPPGRAIKSGQPPRAEPKTSAASQPAAPPRALSGPLPKAAVNPEIQNSLAPKPKAAPASSSYPSPAGSGLSDSVARTADPVPGKAVVFNSPWNQSVTQVERYLKRHAHNADSIEVLEWGKVARVEQGYQVRCRFRSRNVLGHIATQSKVFVLDKNGEVSDIRD